MEVWELSSTLTSLEMDESLTLKFKLGEFSVQLYRIYHIKVACLRLKMGIGVVSISTGHQA